MDKEAFEEKKEKAYDFLNKSDEKIGEFVKEHGLEDKVDEAARMLEGAAMDVAGGVKNFFNKNKN